MTIAPSAIAGELYNTAKACGQISTKTDTLKKTLKVVVSGAQVSTNIADCCSRGVVGEALGPVSGAFSHTASVINAAGMFNTLWCFINSGERANIVKSPEKTACKVTLLAAQVMELTRFIDKVSVNFFGQTANCLGFLPIFDIVKNSLYAISAAFSIVLSAKDLKRAEGDISHAKTLRAKVQKREKSFATLDTFDLAEKTRKYEGKLQTRSLSPEKQARAEKYQELLNGEGAVDSRISSYWEQKAARRLDKYNEKLNNIGSSEALRGRIEDLTTTIQEAKDDLESSKNKQAKRVLRESIKTSSSELREAQSNLSRAEKLETYVAALSNPDTRVEEVRRLIDHKITVCNIRESNGKALKTKSWIGIAAEVGKIFMIVVGMLIIGLSFIFPVLTAPAVALTLSLLGLGSNGAGLAKNLFRDVWYTAKLRQEPQFKLASASA